MRMMRSTGRRAVGEVDSVYAWLRLLAGVLTSTIGGVGMWSIAVVLPTLQADFGDVRDDENWVPSRQELAEVRKLLMNPQVRNAVPNQLIDEWIAAVAERTGTNPDRDLYPRLVVAVVRAIGDAAAEAYVRAEPPVAITELIRAGFAAVSAGMPEPNRKDLA